MSICGEAVLHDCLPRLETIYGFDSRGSSDVRVTSLLMSSDVRIFRQFASLPKRQQPKRRTNEKVWGAQEKGVGGTGGGCESDSTPYRDDDDDSDSNSDDSRS